MTVLHKSVTEPESLFRLPAGVTVHLCMGVTDMRKGCYTLAAKIQAEIGVDPLGGEVFAFFNRNRKQAKLLWFDGDGFSLLTKYLQAGTFSVRKEEGRNYQAITGVDLNLLLSGIPLARIVYRKKVAARINS